MKNQQETEKENCLFVHLYMIYIFPGKTPTKRGSAREREGEKKLKVNSHWPLFKQSQKPLKENDYETISLYLIYHKIQGLTKAMRTKVG
jgi:hypothetical protein